MYLRDVMLLLSAANLMVTLPVPNTIIHGATTFAQQLVDVEPATGLDRVEAESAYGGYVVAPPP